MSKKSGAIAVSHAMDDAPRRRAATGRSSTRQSKPPATSSEAVVSTKITTPAPRGRKAMNTPLHHADQPSANLSVASEAVEAVTTGSIAPRRRKSSQAIRKPNATQGAPGRRKRGAPPTANTEAEAPPAEPVDPVRQTCLRLALLARARRFCIVSQSRADRAMQAEIAHCLGYDPTAEEADRKRVFKWAGQIIAAVEAGKPYDAPPPGDPRSEMLAEFLPFIPISAASRSVWDQRRETIETEMRRLAMTLPVWEWVRVNAKGVGELGLGRIVGEAPMIGLYATHERLWKRMGVAVIAGERQAKRTNVDEALLHGYAPYRRAELWSVCSDVMLRQQWRRAGNDPDDLDAFGVPIGPYGAVYGRRKALTLMRVVETDALPFTDRAKWTRKRCDADARRVMSKEFLRDLWRVWHGKDARHPARFAADRQAA
jgi:hypothetical protein